MHFQAKRERRNPLSPLLVPELLPSELSAHAELDQLLFLPDPSLYTIAPINEATPIRITKTSRVVIGCPFPSFPKGGHQFQFPEPVQSAVEHDSSLA